MRGPLIIGGGPAGASAAIVLAQAGADPIVLERTAGPHDKVCGDFLSGEAAAALTALGVDLAALDPAPIRRVRLVQGQRAAGAPLPFPAYGLSRRTLDEALLARAGTCGARVLRGSTVRSLEPERGGLRVVTDQCVWQAGTAFMATGKYDVRGVTRPRNRRMVGLKTYLRLAEDQYAALGDTVEIVLTKHGYIGLQPVERGRVVLCALLTDARGADFSAMIHAIPHLRRRLSGARSLLARSLAVAGMPYGYIAGPAGPDRLFRLGDQAGVIPSFAGAGVEIALNSGQAAARAFIAGMDGLSFQRAIGGALARPIGLARQIHSGLLHPVMQSLAFYVCCAWPAVMAQAAALTRIPELPF